MPNVRLVRSNEPKFILHLRIDNQLGFILCSKNSYDFLGCLPCLFLQVLTVSCTQSVSLEVLLAVPVPVPGHLISVMLRRKTCARHGGKHVQGKKGYILQGRTGTVQVAEGAHLNHHDGATIGVQQGRHARKQFVPESVDVR